MKVLVRLFGTYSLAFPDYQPSQGIEVEVPDGATVTHLLAVLGLSECRGVVVISDGRVLKADDRMRHGVSVNVMQAISGG